MQACFTVGILVLQAEWLVCAIRSSFRRSQPVYSLNRKKLPSLSLISLGMPIGRSGSSGVVNSTQQHPFVAG